MAKNAFGDDIIDEPAAPKTNDLGDVLLDEEPEAPSAPAAPAKNDLGDEVLPEPPEETIRAAPTFAGELMAGRIAPAASIAYEALRRPFSGLIGPTEAERSENMVQFGTNADGSPKYEYKPLGDRFAREGGMMTPIVEPPRFEPSPTDSTLEGIVKGVDNAAMGLAGSFMSPLGALLPGAAEVKPLARVASGLFAGDMLAHVPGQVKQAITAPTIQEKVEGGLGAVVGAGLGGLAGKHAVKGTPAAPAAPAAEAKPPGAPAAPVPPVEPAAPPAAEPAPPAAAVSVVATAVQEGVAPLVVLKTAAADVEAAGLPATAEALRKLDLTPEPAAVPKEEPAPAAGAPEAPGTEKKLDPAKTPEIHRSEVELLDSLENPAYEPTLEKETPAGTARAPKEPARGGLGKGSGAKPAGEESAVSTETEVSGLTPREIPLDQLTLSKDVPQFKSGADEQGVVEALEGSFDSRDVGPIQVWRRLDGRLEVISGRHRFDLANRDPNKASILAQVHDEAAGFDARAAATLDAELNIRDGQGSVADYANYFRNAEVTEADASSRGLLARAKGKAGFSIGRDASEDVFALHQSGRLSDAQAEAVASAAPGNEAAQRIGLRAMQGGASFADAANAIRAAVSASKDVAGVQGDFFSDTGLDEQWLKMGRVATDAQKELREKIISASSASKKPEVAKAMGVDVNDPEAVRAKIAELRAELTRWENWGQHPDLVKIASGEKPAAPAAAPEPAKAPEPAPAKKPAKAKKPKAEAPKAEEPVAPEPPVAPATAAQKPKEDLMAGRADDPFNLVSETHADKLARMKREDAEAAAAEEKAAAEAKAAFDAAQGNLFGSKKDGLNDAYRRLVEKDRFKFPTVSIGALAKEAGLELEAFKARIVQAWREGKVALSKGDWSLSDETTHAGAIIVNGDRYLEVRPLGETLESKTPATPELKALGEIEEALAKAPTAAELSAAGKQPGTVEFQVGARKVVVQNTRESLSTLAQKYRPEDASPGHVQAVGEQIREMSAKVKGVRVRTLRTEADLPPEVRSRMDPRAVHEGLVDTDTGDVYIFARNVSSPARAAEVFLHEVVGHYGVEKVLGVKEWGQLSDSIVKTAPKDALADISRKYAGGKDVADLSASEKLTVAREYVARLAEKPALNPPLWRQVVQVVKNALRALGLRKEWSESDIADLLKRAGKAVEEGSESRVVGGELSAAVRDLGKEVEAQSPYAARIEAAFEKALPNDSSRAAVAAYVNAKMTGGDTPALTAVERTVAERFLTYFRNKEDFANRNGVAGAAGDAYKAQLDKNPNLTLPERLAVYSSEANRLVTERTTARTEKPIAPAGGEPTSIRNAVVDREREARGLPPAMEPARRDFGRVWDEAMEIVAKDPLASERLAKELADNPRPVEDFEDALLLHRQIELQNAYDQAGADYLKAADAGDTAAQDLASAKRGELSDKLLEVYEAGKSVGTANARGLNARKMMADQDFSLAKMETDERVTTGGAPLSPIQRAEIEALHAKIAELTKKDAAKKAKSTRRKSEKAADEAVAKMVGDVEKEQAAPAAAKGAKTDKVLAYLKTKADEARARIRERRKNLNALVDPSIILDYAVIGAELVARGSVSIGRFGAKLVLEFGDEIRPHIPEIFKKSKELAAEARSERDIPAEKAKIVEGIKSRMEEGDTIADLPGYVRKLALNFVRSGIVEREPLIDAVHEIVQELAPGMTRRETMDLISGYGDFKALDKEEAKVTLRDLKGQMQQIGKLEDMAGGTAPKKTGVQRREPSIDEKKLLREVNEAKKAGGFEVTDPETQLRSALGAKERALTNEIRMVAEEIETGEVRKAPAPSPVNDRIEVLRGLLERLRKTKEDLFGKKEITDEQRLAAAIEAADRATAEYTRQLEEADFSRKAGKPKLSSPEYDAAVARRNAARAERDEYKALDEGVRQQKEARRTRQLEEQIVELDRKLREGDTDPAKPAAPLLTPEQEALVSERNAMLKLLEEIRRAPKSDAVKQVERLVKQVNELDRRLTEGDLDPKKPGAVKPLSPEAADLMMMREAMQKELEAQRAAAKPKLTDAEIALKRWKSATTRRIADLLDRAAKGQFENKPRLPMTLDPEGTQIAFDLEKAKEEFITRKFENMLRQRSTTAKILGTAGELVNTARATMTAFDLSAIGRQGGFIVLAHPIRGIRALPSMFKAMKSERGEFAVNEEIANRPNADLYRQAKLDLTKRGASLLKMEEAYMSRWAEKIPGVGVSGRAYRVFLNRLRADSFDAMVKSLAGGRSATLAEAKAIANFVNVATGRGALNSKLATAAVGLNHVFFAPRLVLSRFQLLLGQPLWGGSARTRAMIAGEYARYLVGVGVVVALAKAAGAGDIDDDPRSTDFAKLRFGNSRVDPFSGLVQATVFARRVGGAAVNGALSPFGVSTGPEMKSNKGDVYSLRTLPGEKRKFGQQDTADVIFRFLRTKLSPAVGSAVDLSTGRNVVGQTVTPQQTAARMFWPLTFGEIYNSMQEQGMPGGAALALLSILGAGVQTYDEKAKTK